MKYLITGGAGFIGSHIADALVARGDQVVVLDDLSTGNNHNLDGLIGNPNFDFVRGSILDSALVDSVVASVDYVLHFAAAVGVFTIVDHPLASLKTNLAGTENLLAACLRYSRPFLLASTSEIYGKNGGGPLHEESDRIVGSPLVARWSYSEAKAIDESLAYFYYAEHGLPVRILRFFNTVGPRQVGRYGMVVPRFVEAALHGDPLSVYGDGKQSRCFCHVGDAVRGVLLALDSPAAIGEAINIGNNHEVTIGDLASTVITRLDSVSSIMAVPYSEAYGTGFEDMARRVPDISKAAQLLGWSPQHDLARIIDDVAAYLREHH